MGAQLRSPLPSVPFGRDVGGVSGGGHLVERLICSVPNLRRQPIACLLCDSMAHLPAISRDYWLQFGTP